MSGPSLLFLPLHLVKFQVFNIFFSSFPLLADDFLFVILLYHFSSVSSFLLPQFKMCFITIESFSFSHYFTNLMVFNLIQQVKKFYKFIIQNFQAASPACTELETIVLDWFGKAMGLPSDFLSSTPNSEGGGVIQSSASECILITMLAARNQAIKNLKNDPGHDDSLYLPKLIAYCSKEAHSCVEKAAMILLVKLKTVDVDENGSLCGEALECAMNEDESSGLLPFYVATTLGTTSSCSFDNLDEIGVICKNKPCVWLHVDGAYAGSAFICPELRYLLAGMEYADSFNTNTNKWLLVSFDCSCLWVRDRRKLTEALTVDPLYLQHKNSSDAIDYRHWGIPLSRRFRALKLWFVLRTYGISGLQAYIRNHIELAKVFESLVRGDDRFEIMNVVRLGLVCFRLVGSDAINQKLLAKINASGEIHIIPSTVKEKYTIRFCVVAEKAKLADIHHAWKTIVRHADELKETHELFPASEINVSLKVKEECRLYFKSISQDLSDHRTKMSPGIISV